MRPRNPKTHAMPSTVSHSSVVTSSATSVNRAVATRWAVYACFFFSGATALIYEVLWSSQFVTIFGNSSYAVSTVLCAFMTGIGLGGLLGGRLADRLENRLRIFGFVLVGIAAWAMFLPVLLAGLRDIVPTLRVFASESLLLGTLARFGLTFGVLAVPCFLMGATLPLLTRVVTASDRSMSRRIGALYCWNTLGACVGCLAAGFWLLDTLGKRATNGVAVGVDLLIGCVAIALASRRLNHESSEPDVAPAEAGHASGLETDHAANAPGWLFLGIAFANGLAGLVCEVVWFRYLAFLIVKRAAYVFPTILCLYLLGLGLGGLIYSALARRIRNAVGTLAVVQVLLAVSVLGTFALGATIFASGPPRPLELPAMAALTLVLPTTLMGFAFPLLCQLYGRRVEKLGQRVGLLYAVNTAGTVLGSLLPIFVLVPALGIQRSLWFAAVIFGATGLALLPFGAVGSRRFSVLLTATAAAGVGAFIAAVPSDLCQRVFLATGFYLGKQTDILAYREGRTGTAVVTRDRVNQRKTVYINGNAEVPALYAHQLCFKMLGDLGPMLHSQPDDVLMICFGGGIAAGATTCLPEVKSLTIVDLESTVVDVANQLADENNRVLQNSKTHVVIDDGRNYIATSSRRWPVIITDSTHPKASDSWVLYSQEFYQRVRERLTDNGVFVQWVPTHSLSVPEYKIILRTFQSVFPHASLWVNAGMDEQGQFISYSLLVATPQPLGISAAKLRERLSAEPVRRDLEPYGLQAPAGFLDAFVCADDALRRAVGDGPVNTDNMPYTYYTTRYTNSRNAGLNGFFIDSMEDIWPKLRDTGSTAEADALHRELATRAEANKLALSGRLADAYALLPDDVRFRQMRRLYEQAPQYIDALAGFYPRNADALVFLAGWRVSGPNAPAAIRPMLARALELDPDNVDALSTLGGMESDAGELAPAETHLRRAVRLEPRFGDAHYNLGNVLFQKGSSDEAIAQYEKALQLRPDLVEAHINLGTLFSQTNRLQEAIAHFETALALQPRNAAIHYSLGNILLQKGSAEEALGHFRRGLELRPRDPVARNAFANLLVQKGDFEEAVAQYREAIALKPDYLNAHYNLGGVLLQQGKLDDAATHYARVLELKPDDVEAHDNLGSIFHRKGKYDEAIGHFEKALAVKADDVQAQNNLAWIFAASPRGSLRDGARAVKLAEQANRSAGGENLDILYTLSVAYAEARRFGEATQSAQKAMDLARSAGRQAMVECLVARLKLFQAGVPFHEESK